MKDAQDSLRRHREARIAKEKASGKSIHPQPVIQSAGAPKKMGVIQKVKIALEIRKLIKQHDPMKGLASWKTLLGGVIAASAPLIAGILPPDFAWVNQALLSLGTLIIGASARDNSVSSQQAGVRPEVK